MKNCIFAIIGILILNFAFSESPNVLYRDGMEGTYISDYKSDNSCVSIKSASGYDENYLGGAVRNWKLEIVYAEKVELSFIGFIGAESKRTYSKNSRLAFPVKIIEKNESTEITEVTLTGYDLQSKRFFFEAYIESFKGNYAYLSGYFSKELKNKIFDNESLNKNFIVSENLKLRLGESNSTKVLAVMSVGTKVKILDTGKVEIIDDIKSNWVKVEVLSGAKDRDGKPIKKGTVGWCYGGYLTD